MQEPDRSRAMSVLRRMTLLNSPDQVTYGFGLYQQDFQRKACPKMNSGCMLMLIALK